MDTVYLETEAIDTLKWPSGCPRCGKNLEEDTDAEIRKYHGKKWTDTGSIRKHWESAETNTLLDTWIQNDQISWRPETFDVIKQMLRERGVEIPPQEDRKLFAASFVGLPVKKELRAWLSRKPKAVAMRLCMRCARRARRWRTISNVAGTFMLLSIIGGAFVLNRTDPAQHQEVTYGAAATFWFWALFLAVGNGMWKRNTGVKIIRTSRTGWKFLFRNADIASEFARLNKDVGATGKT